MCKNMLVHWWGFKKVCRKPNILQKRFVCSLSKAAYLADAFCIQVAIVTDLSQQSVTRGIHAISDSYDFMIFRAWTNSAVRFLKKTSVKTSCHRKDSQAISNCISPRPYGFRKILCCQYSYIRTTPFDGTIWWSCLFDTDLVSALMDLNGIFFLQNENEVIEFSFLRMIDNQTNNTLKRSGNTSQKTYFSSRQGVVIQQICWISSPSFMKNSTRWVVLARWHVPPHPNKATFPVSRSMFLSSRRSSILKQVIPRPTRVRWQKLCWSFLYVLVWKRFKALSVRCGKLATPMKMAMMKKSSTACA